MQKTLLLSIYLIILVKILFIIFELIYLFEMKNHIKNDSVKYWKLKFEWLFNILMSLVLIHIFYPFNNKLDRLTSEIKKLIFLYSILSLFSLLWTNNL